MVEYLWEFYQLWGDRRHRRLGEYLWCAYESGRRNIDRRHVCGGRGVVLCHLHRFKVQYPQRQLTLSGAGSEFATLSLLDVTNQIDSTLGTIGTSGDLALLAGRSFTNTLGFGDSGLLQLGGGTFSTAALTVRATGKILGYGVVTPAIANSGVIEADGGVLELTGALSGSGKTQIDAGATLELGAASAEAVSFGGAIGTLRLDDPSSFSGVIGGLAPGDVIDLVGVTTTGPVNLSGSVLSVPTTGGTLTFHFANAPAGVFNEEGDGASGTNLVYGAADVPTLLATVH